MESNGKSAPPTASRGAPSAGDLGRDGTDAQHAGSSCSTRENTWCGRIRRRTRARRQDRASSRLLLKRSQGRRRMARTSSDDPYKNFPRNRPSSTICSRARCADIGGADPFYEHRTFAVAVTVDQSVRPIGVELGKRLARDSMTRASRKIASTPGMIEKQACNGAL